MHAKQDAWISVLIHATLYGVAVVWVNSSLAQYFGDKTFGRYVQMLLGKPLGILVGSSYLGFLLLLTMIITREFGEFLNTAFMPETPIQVFNLTLILLAAYAVYHGIEVICRINQWIFPLMLVSFLFITFATLPVAKLANLLPVMSEGLYPVLRGSFAPSAFRGEVFLVLFLVPYAKEAEKTKFYGAVAVILLGIILALDVLIHIIVLGSDLSANLTFPTFILARYVQIGIFERMEALVMVTWVAGVIVKLSIFYYAAFSCIKDCIKVRKTSWILLTTSLILYFGSLYIFTNVLELFQFIDKHLPLLALIFELIIPLTLLVIAKFRLIGGKTY
jgi:spore germination protein KB